MGDVTVDFGVCDFSGGVDSIRVPTIASSENPNGLASNQLAWLSNGTVRDGGISQRPTWQPLLKLAEATALWQGGAIYEPDNANPYLMFSVSGKIFLCDPDGAAPVLISTTLALSNPPLEPYGFFDQGEQFMIIQAGDNVTLPLFWDGSLLRRSDGPSINLGVTSANFTAPAINHAVFITTSWHGYAHQRFEVNGDTGAKYIRVTPEQFLTLKNRAANIVGSFDAGSEVVNAFGVAVSKLIVGFTIPAVGASDNAWVTPGYNGIVGDLITIGGQQFEVMAIGTTNPGVGQIRAVNINQTAGTVNTQPVSLTSIQEITAASPMDYYQGRLWYGIGRQYLAGDIVRGPSGTAFYDFRDSILKVTENPLVLAGDGFTVPDNAGNLRAIFHNANINTTLGQGNLYPGTRKAIYSLDVPVTRADWIAADNSKQPKQTIVQLANGPVNDRSVTLVNGDVWYQTLEPSIASLFTSVRNFSQWGNISLSANINRILQFNDRALMRFACGVYFQNRMLQTALPKQLPQGVVHQALVPLDFVPISSFGATLTPNFEGSWSGLDILQMWTADFGGRERCFAAVVSKLDGAIWLWELSTAGRFEGATSAERVASVLSGGSADIGNRVEWYFETPSFTFSDIKQLKKLVGCELGIDRLVGTAEFQMDYRSDSDPCWHLWCKWQLCSARNSTEDVVNPTTYPLIEYCPGYKANITLPKPQEKCQGQTGRPEHIGYAFQCRLTVKGYCRVRSIRLYAEKVERKLYTNMVQPVTMPVNP